MAYGKHWTVPFSKYGNNPGISSSNRMWVDIYEDGYTGDVIELKGHGTPFITKEQDDEDVFRTVRSQSGYLRIVTDDASLLESLMPEKSFSRYVVLRSNTGVYWTGFIKTEAYDQEWVAPMRTLSLPVTDWLGVMDCMTPSISFDSSAYKNVAEMLHLIATTANNITGMTSISGVTIINDAYVTGEMLTHRIDMNKYVEYTSMKNEGVTTYDVEFADALTILDEICGLYGLTARMKGTTLYLAHYDTLNDGELPGKYQYSLAALENIADGTQTPSWGGLIDADMSLTAATDWTGADNSMTLYKGKKSVKVILDMSEQPRVGISMPETDADSSQTYQVETRSDGTSIIVTIQPHAPSTRNYCETYRFYKYTRPDVYAGASSYQNCLENSVMFIPLLCNHWSYETPLHTGAFPIRYKIEGDTSSETMKSGILLRPNYLGDDFTTLIPRYCYAIRSLLPVDCFSGYLDIDMKMRAFAVCGTSLSSRPQYLHLTRDVDFYMDLAGWTNYLICMLHWGDYEWVEESAGSGYAAGEWRLHESGTDYHFFRIRFSGESVISNHSLYDDQDLAQYHYIVPCPENIPMARMELSILNVVQLDNPWDEMMERTHNVIVSDLSVSHIYSEDTGTETGDTSNVYYKKTGGNFGGQEEKTLTLGTFNNNVHSTALIKDASDEYVEQMTYGGGDSYTRSSTTGYTDRPEKHLLNRMAKYYARVRREIVTEVREKTDLLTYYTQVIDTHARRYLLGDGRIYMAIDAEHDWRENRQKLKLLEVDTVTGSSATSMEGKAASFSIEEEAEVEETTITAVQTDETNETNETEE